ncbi:YjcZ family sporulation protein [Sporolactobacillus vineae]|nr:YjcZ family sporulation protein [Sporolactobacillus vineae]
MGAAYNHSSSFALIVVLFILLIIVGTAFVY